MTKNERIEHLEDHIQVLLNRVALLEMKVASLEAKNRNFGPGNLPPAAPPAWPGWTPPTWNPPPITPQFTLHNGNTVH